MSENLLDDLVGGFIGQHAPQLNIGGQFGMSPKGEARDAGEGNQYVFKNGTRLKRPTDNLYGGGETFGQFINEQGPQSMAGAFGNPLGSQGQNPQVSDTGNSFGGFIDNAKSKTFNILKSLGQITGIDGSSLWKEGLDIDLQKGDPVPSPVGGTVSFVGPRGGFGNQVRVTGDDGREYWLSHLDATKVQMGQKINAGEIVGLGGNTGNTIPGPGGDGSHLDLTVRENGKYIPARSVADLLRTYS